MSPPVFNIKSFKINFEFVRNKLPYLKLKNKNLKLIKGFTLIELLVVISIIGILMAVATVSYINAQQKGRDNKRKSDLKAVQQALELYYQQKGKYPPNVTGGLIQCDGGGGGFTWGTTSFICNSVTYMNPLPRDPIINTLTQYYYYTDNIGPPANSTYKLYAKIENVKDQDLINTLTACGTAPPASATISPWATNGNYYCVINP